MLSRRIFSAIGSFSSSILSTRTFLLNGVISRAELCLSCHLLDAEKEKKARPPLTDREFEGKPGYLVVKAPLEKCIEYLKSESYKAVYGDDPVWKNYRRNVVGTYAIRLRTTCIRKGIISTGSACPICRDDYLKFDYRHTELLKQFAAPETLQAMNPKITGLCEKQYKNLQIELMKAKDRGTLEKYYVPRVYNMKYYKGAAKQQSLLLQQEQAELDKNTSDVYVQSKT